MQTLGGFWNALSEAQGKPRAVATIDPVQGHPKLVTEPLGRIDGDSAFALRADVIRPGGLADAGLIAEFRVRKLDSVPEQNEPSDNEFAWLRHGGMKPQFTVRDY